MARRGLPVHNARVKRLKFWGWGYEDEGPDEAARARLARSLGERFGRSDLALVVVVAPTFVALAIAGTMPRSSPSSRRSVARMAWICFSRGLRAGLGMGSSWQERGC